MYEVNRKDCAKYLLNLPHNCEPRFFKPASSGDDDSMDEDDEEESSGWVLSDLLAEVKEIQILMILLLINLYRAYLHISFDFHLLISVKCSTLVWLLNFVELMYRHSPCLWVELSRLSLTACHLWMLNVFTVSTVGFPIT